ncbi:hypothetical protein cypCar_00000074 [Cyprinus carpio]|nr:hypothetical protein cypCar_00000074 [Cyprinus carpio]
MNREEHYYPPNQLYKDSCAFQRHPNEDYSQNPPPCLYMSRQTQPVYASPSLGSQDQPNLTDITSYNMPTRDDLAGPHLHLPQTPQTSLQTLGGYGDSLDLCGDRSRYHLPFPWMKSLHGGGRGEQAHADGVHQSAAARARERVSLQQVHLPPAPRGARAHLSRTVNTKIGQKNRRREVDQGEDRGSREWIRTGFLDHVRRSEGGVVCRSGHGTPLTSALSPTSSPTRLVKQTLTKRDMCHQRNLSACHRRVEILV